MYHVYNKLEGDECQSEEIHQGNYVSVARKMLCLCGYLKNFKFSVKYKSTSLVNSSGPIHDTELQMTIKEQEWPHLLFEYRSFLLRYIRAEIEANQL